MGLQSSCFIILWASDHFFHISNTYIFNTETTVKMATITLFV